MNGKLMTMTKIDDETVKLTFPEPNPLFMELSSRGHYNSAQWLVPAHYMKKFDPKYNKDEKDYTDLLARYNVETRLQQIGMPTLDAWAVTDYTAGQHIVAKRNPFYFKVDSDGHQLPYIDGIDSTLANGDSVRQLALLNAASGKIDFQSREFNLKDVPLLIQNQKAGGYTVKMWQRGDFAWPWIMPIYDTKDKGIVDLYYQQPFREALSYAINRDRINKVVAYGLAKPRQFSQIPESPEFQSPEGKAFYAKWSQSYAQFDPDKAKSLLDSVGVKDVDGDGFRERPDGTKLQIIVDLVAGDAQSEAAMDLIKEDWEKVGIQTELNPLDSSTLSVRAESGDMMMRAWPSAAAWNLLSSATVWAPIQDAEWTMGGKSISRYYATGGKQGTAPRPGSMLEKLQQAYAKIITITDPAERNKALLDAYKIHLDDGPITIGTIGESPSPVVVSNKLHNVQDTGLIGSWDLGFPASADPEQFYFSN
jgi:peptide/nickel transport system substrate-binding protein